jgi:replicative DNA helicase
MPHDAAAERAVIGCMLLDPECIADVADIVQPEDFYSDDRARIFEAALDVHKVGKGVEILLVQSELSARGAPARVADEVLECTNTIPTKHEAYATRVRKLAVARRLMRTAMEVAADGGAPIGDVDVFLDESEQKLRTACDERGDDTQVLSMADAVTAVFQQYHERSQSPGGLLGVPTGIHSLDRITLGLQRGKMYVVAGRPGTGKTSLAVQVAVNAAQRAETRALVVSLEMLEDEVATRVLSSESRIDSRKIAQGALPREEAGAFSRAVDAVSRLDIGLVVKSGLTETAIRRIARKDLARNGLGLLVIDYLGLVRPSVRDKVREREISDMSRAFKSLATELRIPVVLCAQLNRDLEKRADKRPIMSDLRESGAIEQDADAIIFTHHDDKTNASELIVAKQRGGRVGTVKVVYDRPTTTFRQLEEHHTSAHGEHWQDGPNA